MYQNYVFQNFKQLDHYRLPSSAVPEYLHGRPPSVVKHCLIRKTKSNKYTQDAVKHAKTPGEFYVIKDTKKHTLNFGTSNNSTVACSCKDWKKWHIPCKHFFAVFRWVPEWNWNSMPHEYRNSAYLSTDNSAIEEYLAMRGVCDFNESVSDDAGVSSSKQFHGDDVSGSVIHNEVTSDPVPTKRVRKSMCI